MGDQGNVTLHMAVNLPRVNGMSWKRFWDDSLDPFAVIA